MTVNGGDDLVLPDVLSDIELDIISGEPHVLIDLLPRASTAIDLTIPGSQGPTGPAGPPGTAGVPGADGVTGPIGPAGPAGVPGPQGPTGSQGLQGVPGIGAVGATGAAGPTGPRGLQGLQGLAGATGATGAAGAVGPTGPPGSSGTGTPGVVLSFPTPTASWVGVHGLNQTPVDVTLVDLAGNQFGGDVSFPNLNTAQATFGLPVAGFMLVQK